MQEDFYYPRNLEAARARLAQQNKARRLPPEGRAAMRRTPNVLLLAAACKAGVMNENFPLPFDVHIRSTRIVATVQSEQFELRPTAFDYCLTMSGFLIY